jgi:NTE family protein
MERLPFTLALGGGGARGIAHIGVFRAFDRHSLEPSCILGSSIGAITGAMYAQNPDIGAVMRRIERFFASDFFRKIGLDYFTLEDAADRHTMLDQWMRKVRGNYILSKTITRESALPEEVLREALAYLIDDTDIAECRIPFGAVATDLRTGDVVVVRSGSLATAVAASASIPAITKPVELDGMLLIDGGASCITPVAPARDINNDPVVAVDVWKTVSHQKMPDRGVGILIRAGEITQLNLNRVHVEQADIVIRPAVQEYEWMKFSRYAELIAKGEEAAAEKIPAIRDVCRKRGKAVRWKIRDIFRKR